MWTENGLDLSAENIVRNGATTVHRYQPQDRDHRDGDAEFDRGLVRLMPNLKAFAMSLSSNVHRADDLVQDTLLKALSNREKFTYGTNLRAWLFTILRNTFLSQLRTINREIPTDETEEPPQGQAMSEQEARSELWNVAKTIELLPSDQRQALLLVGSDGFSYGEAASICNCPIGTIKSRVNRARRRLDEKYGRA